MTTSIEKWEQWDDCTIYKTSCSCGMHEISFWVGVSEMCEEVYDLTLNMKVASTYPYTWPSSKKWYRRILCRIKGALQLLFYDNIVYEESFIFNGEQHIQDFIDALNEGIEHIKKKKD